jgi:tRNA threonylcarbamoyladenosine biosynthesis protein TsaE
MQVISRCVAETLKLGKKIARNLSPGDIICLRGNLGAGKTVLVKGIAQGLGISKETVVSPSFVLIRQYKGHKLSLNHFDLYRLSSRSEIPVLGYEEFFYSDAVTVIEWAERLECLLPKDHLRVDLSITKNNQRLFILSSCGSHYRELLRRINENIGH